MACGTVLTLVGHFGTLDVDKVILALGPRYLPAAEAATATNRAARRRDADALLRRSYQGVLEAAYHHDVTSLGSALLSAGEHRGDRELSAVTDIACRAIRDFSYPDLLVALVAFTDAECQALAASMRRTFASSSRAAEASEVS